MLPNSETTCLRVVNINKQEECFHVSTPQHFQRLFSEQNVTLQTEKENKLSYKHKAAHFDLQERLMAFHRLPSSTIMDSNGHALL